MAMLDLVSAPLSPLRRAVLEALSEAPAVGDGGRRSGSGRPASASTTTCARSSAPGWWSSSRSVRGGGARSGSCARPVPTRSWSSRPWSALPEEQDRFAADTMLAGGARLVRDVAAARTAASERGQRLLTFAIEAEVGFDRPADVERFTDALADGSPRWRPSSALASPVPRRRRRSSRMSMDKPYRVEVTVDAPRDEVWRALTEPEQIRHWFGWEYDGLEGEIELIFRAHEAPPARPHRDVRRRA